VANAKSGDGPLEGVTLLMLVVRERWKAKMEEQKTTKFKKFKKFKKN